jgi:hypothetical protein
MICAACNDTHRRHLEGRGDVMCTRCPTPCRNCARDDGRGVYCAETPCACACHNHKTNHDADNCRALLTRIVKYAKEDKARTPGSTRLQRAIAQAEDYLRRTHDPMSVLRGEIER